MIERPTDNSDQRRNVAFEFIQERFGVYAQKYGADRIKELQNADVYQNFWKLTNYLDAERKAYSFHALQERDKRAQEEALKALPTESAKRNYRLGREDEGVPTHLEMFFLSKLSTDEWRKICESAPDTSYKDSSTGAINVRGIIENVLGDQPRTRAFIEAVRDGVRRTRGNNVYDVGCGPFPVLAIAAALENPQAKVHCIEINPLSATIAAMMIQKLGLSKQISIEIADALKMSLPENEQIDLLISETAGAGLLDEQITQIIPRFAKKLSPNGLAIPSRVNITAALTPLDKGIYSDKGELKSRYGAYIINTNSEALPRLEKKEWQQITHFEEEDLTRDIPAADATIDIPETIQSMRDLTNYTVSISAELILDKAGRHILHRYQSAPTTPVVYGFINVPSELTNENPRDYQLRFTYEPGSSSMITSRKIVLIKKGA